MKIKYLIGTSAILLSLLSAYFSIVGISTLCGAKILTIGLMAGTFEFTKVVSIAYASARKDHAKKVYMFFAVILIIISSTGIYAYLLDAYGETAHKYETDKLYSAVDTKKQELASERKDDAETQINIITQDINQYRKAIADNNERKFELQKAMNADTTGSISWYNNINEINKENTQFRSFIEQSRERKQSLINKLDTLSTEVVNAMESKVAREENEVDLGPLAKLSDITGWPMDTIVKYYFLIFIIIFDPAAVLSIYKYVQLSQEDKKKEKKKE